MESIANPSQARRNVLAKTLINSDLHSGTNGAHVARTPNLKERVRENGAFRGFGFSETRESKKISHLAITHMQPGTAVYIMTTVPTSVVLYLCRLSKARCSPSEDFSPGTPYGHVIWSSTTSLAAVA